MNQKKTILNAIINDFTEAADASSHSLLIEIGHQHLSSFTNEKESIEFINQAAYTAYHDSTKVNEGSNVLVINEPDIECIDLVKLLLARLDNDIQELLFNNVVNTAFKGAITFSIKTFSGGLSDFIPDDIVTERLIDGANLFKAGVDHLAESTHGLINPSEELVDYSASKVDKDVNIHTRDKDKFYISAEARSKLEKLVLEIQSPIQDEAKAMRIVIDLLRILSINAPKLIIIHQPEKLSKASIGIISLLMAYEKSFKEQSNNSSTLLTTGVSVCLVYPNNDKQLSSDSSVDQYIHSSRVKELNDLHNFSQRYQLLETPDNNRPKQAISNEKFVGRKTELITLAQRSDIFNSNSCEDSFSHSADIVMGDAGMGKTKLIQQHIHSSVASKSRIEQTKNTSNLLLNIFNCNGYSSRASGLAALRQSIENQAQKLDEEIDKSKSQRFKNEIKKRLTGKGLLGTICSYFSLPAEAVDIGNSMNNYISRNNRSNELTDLNNATAGEAPQTPIKQQFVNIDKAISKLAEIATELNGNDVALTIFIDDLHWLDEFSAQYILGHLCHIKSQSVNFKSKVLPVRFVISTRKSDLATRIKEDMKQAAVDGNIYFLLLINALDLDFSQSLSNRLTNIFDEYINNSLGDTEVQKNSLTLIDRLKSYQNMIDAELIHLTGFTLNDIKSLIEKSINSTPVQREVLATALALQIGNNKQVNTMHLVESLNMLCDPWFYTQKKFINSPVQPLIQYIGAKPKIIIDENEIADCINEIFNILALTYKESFKSVVHNKRSSSVSFNLSALAVLEERLQLIQRHVGPNYSEACKNTLLIGNLLGDSFDERLIKNCISALIAADEKDYPGIGSLKSVFDQPNSVLDEGHYETLEEIYNIISRVQALYSELEYQMSHSLWKSFLFIHIENWLRLESLKSGININKIKDSFCQCLINATIETFTDLKPQSFNEQSHLNGRLLNAEISISEFGYSTNKDRWAYTYCCYLVNASVNYLNQSNPKSIELLNKSVDIINQEISKASSITMKDEWSTTLYRTQLHLANAFQKFGQLEKEKSIRQAIADYNQPFNIDDYLQESNDMMKKLESGDIEDFKSEDGNIYIDMFNPMNMFSADIDSILNHKDYFNEDHFLKIEKEFERLLNNPIGIINLQELNDFSEYLSESLLARGEVSHALKITLTCHQQMYEFRNNAQITSRYVSCCIKLAEIYFKIDDNNESMLSCIHEAIYFIQENNISNSVELAPVVTELYVKYAYYNVHFKNYDTAIKSSKSALEIINSTPGNVKINEFDKYRALNTLAQCYKVKEEYNQAIAKYLSALEYLDSLPVEILTTELNKKLIIYKGLCDSYLELEKLELAFEYASHYFEGLKETTSEFCQSKINSFFNLGETLMKKLFMKSDYLQCGTVLEHLFHLLAHSFKHLPEQEFLKSIIELSVNFANSHYQQFQVFVVIEDEINGEPLDIEKTFHLFIAQNFYSHASLIIVNTGNVVGNISMYRSIQEQELKMLKHANKMAYAFEMKLDMSIVNDPDNINNTDSAFIYANNCIVNLSSGLSSLEEKQSVRNEATRIFSELCALGYIDEVRYHEKLEDIEEASKSISF